MFQKMCWWASMLSWGLVLVLNTFQRVPVDTLAYPLTVTMLWLLLRLGPTRERP